LESENVMIPPRVNKKLVEVFFNKKTFKEPKFSNKEGEEEEEEKEERKEKKKKVPKSNILKKMLKNLEKSSSLKKIIEQYEKELNKVCNENKEEFDQVFKISCENVQDGLEKIKEILKKGESEIAEKELNELEETLDFYRIFKPDLFKEKIISFNVEEETNFGYGELVDEDGEPIGKKYFFES
jgi:hypothetical protein